MSNASSADERITLHLHIGLPKTGTSAIQTFLAQNRKAFAEATGVHYPIQRNASKADQGLLKGGNGQPAARSLGNPDQKNFNIGIQKIEELMAGDHRQVLISSENLSGISNDTFRKMVETLRDRAEVKVIMYVRAQVPHVQSGYLQALGNRGYEKDLKAYYHGKDEEGGFYPGAKLAFLDDLLGADNVTVRKYDRRSLVNGDVVDDFASLFGVTIEPPFIRPPPANLSLDTEHYLYARLASQHRGLATVGKQSLRALESEPDIAALYRRAPQIGGLPVMDAATAREIAEARAKDNALLDSLTPQQTFDLDGDNQATVERLEAMQTEPLTGLSRLELLLLNRMVLLEAEIEALTARLSPRPASEEADEQSAPVSLKEHVKWRRARDRGRAGAAKTEARARRR